MAKVVTIGGGTGTFVVLSALKRVPGIELSAIVSSSDDGGSTGRLRDAYGILPVGDARQALVALSENGNTLRELFTYRFSKGDMAGQNLGNLFLTALADLKGGEMTALKIASKILRVRGRVLPSAETPTTLVAKISDGTTIYGEHLIDERDSTRKPIDEVFLATPAPASEDACRAIAEADAIIIGPGDVYTSLAATLLPTGIREAVTASSAKFIYIMNLFTKAGQTNGLSASAHVKIVSRYAGRAPDCIVLHEGEISVAVRERYAAEGELPVVDDLGGSATISRAEIASSHVVPPVPEDPVPRSLMRHDSEKLRAVLEPLIS